MATHTFDPYDEGTSTEQQAAETAALEQGEKLVAAQTEDKLRRMESTDASEEEVALIAGKFKSQDDLLKAYEELQKKLSSGQKEEDSEEEPSEEVSEEVTEETEEEVPEDANVKMMFDVNARFLEKGSFSEEDVEALSSMDSKDLVNAYLNYFQSANAAQQAAAVTNQQLVDIKATVGGDDAYNSMVGWAAQNLSEQEIADFNSVTSSNSAGAIRFAVEALNNRYRASEGYEAPLISGKKAAPKTKGYRSHAELSRDISDPRYQTDPAFRADVEAKLSKSADLM